MRAKLETFTRSASVKMNNIFKLQVRVAAFTYFVH